MCSRQWIKNPPLCLAIEFNETELAKKLVAKGAEMLKVKSAGAEGNDEAKIVEPHLMTVAFDHENMELIHLLLELEAPLDGKDEHGRTPLKRALAKGNTELVKLLLDHGAKPDDTLFMALDSPNREVIDLLLANGASLEAKNEAGDTPLLVALEKNDLAVAKQLLDSEPYLHVTGRYGQNVVCVATAKQNVPFLRLLLEHGADPNTEFEPGLTEQLKEIIPTKNFQFYLEEGCWSDADYARGPLWQCRDDANADRTRCASLQNLTEVQALARKLCLRRRAH